MSRDQARPRFEILDGLRGIAAIAVLLFHLTVIGVNVSHYGYLAVDFFFVLSGFVMSHAYTNRIDYMGFKKFVQVRLIRMMPLSILGLLIGTSYYLVRYFTQSHSEYELSDIILGSIFNIFLMPKLWISQAPTDTTFPTNTPLWSLSLELILNFFWGYYLIKFKTPVLFSIIIISLSIYVYSVLHFETGDLGATWPTYIGGASRATLGFFIGITLWRYRPSPKRSELLSIIPIITLAICFSMPNIGYCFDIFTVAIVFPVIIYIASSCNYQKDRKLFVLLGSISYPLYAIHLPMLHYTVGVVKSGHLESHAIIVAIVAVVGCLVLSFILDRIFDQPARRYISRKFCTQQPAHTETSPHYT